MAQQGDKMPKRKYSYNTQYVSKRATRYVNRDDKRYDRYVKYKERHGFSPDECWNLDETLVEFLLPRLRYFRNHTIGYPSSIKTFEEWTAILDKIIWSFEEKLRCGGLTDTAEFYKGVSHKEGERRLQEYRDRYREGLDLFGEWWCALWW